MTTPEAIRLALELVPMWDNGSLEREDLVEAATELYRLHEQNQKLLEALKSAEPAIAVGYGLTRVKVLEAIAIAEVKP